VSELESTQTVGASRLDLRHRDVADGLRDRHGGHHRYEKDGDEQHESPGHPSKGSRHGYLQIEFVYSGR
jgi:hypothetical protein